MGLVTLNTAMLVWGALAYALVVLILIFPWRTRQLCDRMGPEVWDPKQSWASTVTAIGALLGTVLSARDLPIKTEGGTIKTEFLGMSIFFGALILIAPLIYNATRTKKKVDDKAGEPGEKKDQYQGYVWSFMLSSLITLWGAVGQVIALFLFFGMLKLSLATAFQWLFGLTLFPLIPLYAWRSIRIAIQTADVAATKKQTELDWKSRGIQKQSEPPLPEWSIL